MSWGKFECKMVRETCPSSSAHLLKVDLADGRVTAVGRPSDAHARHRMAIDSENHLTVAPTPI